VARREPVDDEGHVVYPWRW